MNIKLPTPMQYDGKPPQFNEWTGEVKGYLTVHNIFIEDLLEESTRSQIRWSLLQCREMQLQKIYDASITATHRQSIVMTTTTKSTWTDGKQWRKRRQTLPTSAIH
eukprot:757058-Amphidinium_carterae.1